MRNVIRQSGFAFGIWPFACVLLLLLHVAPAPDVLLAQVTAAAGPKQNTSGGSYRYRPKTRVPPSLESSFKQLAPGGDEFPEEKQAEELAGRLSQMSARLRERPSRAAEIAEWLLSPAFKGAHLLPASEVASGDDPKLEIFRAQKMPKELVLNRAQFGQQLSALVNDFVSVETAEFLITHIEVDHGNDPRVRTTVRFDVTGSVSGGWRGQRMGHWQIQWQHAPDGWVVTEWTAVDYLRSRASAPIFTEVTDGALGRNASFRQQLVPGLDYWAAHLDAVFMPRGMGHHGVSVGDFDGDGLDDLYVSQPEGLPNRLFRNKGDGTFEDVTEAAGLALLDRTSEALFADVDNDGDQD